MKKIKVNQFGKDHWSLLAYVEYRIMNHQGRLDLIQLRVKNPAIQQNITGTNLWKPEYGSRLHGYWNKDGSVNPKLKILDHDDFDCLDDLEDEGLIKSFGTGLNPAYKLTKKGAKIMSALTLHKQEGKNFAEFVPDKTQPKEVQER